VEKSINLTFHNRGLRSFIEVDLCAECPRCDDKGCCGYYSPVFYPLDLYFLHREDREILERIFSLPALTILDSSVTVNSSIDTGGGYRCQFHSRENGCSLAQHQRESVCRHFVCPGIAWWDDPNLSAWKTFFDQLEAWENELNRYLGALIGEHGLTLRRPDDRPRIWALLNEAVPGLLADHPAFLDQIPETGEHSVTRTMVWGNEWPL
jgi:hypothetical protein